MGEKDYGFDLCTSNITGGQVFLGVGLLSKDLKTGPQSYAKEVSR